MKKKAVAPPPPRLLELLAACRPEVAPLVLSLRDTVLQEAPEAAEFVYSGYVVGDVFTFTSPGKAFCHIAAYEKHVNLGFNNGALLEDPHGLLAGTGKRIRHIRIASKQDLKKPLPVYIRAAIAFAMPHPGRRADARRGRGRVG
jgi:uncharacterized protein DUF1801